MNRELWTALGISEQQLPHQHTILVEHQNPIDATFVALSFSSLYLKAGKRVRLFSLTGQLPTHFETCAAKLALNLQRQKQNFTIEDVAQAIVIVENIASVSDEGLLDGLVDFAMDAIIGKISESLNDTDESLIILDGLYLLLDLGASSRRLVSFVQTVAMLCEQSNSCLVLLADRGTKVDDEESGDESSNQPDLCTTSQLLGASADCRIRFEPLGGGFGKDVTGTAWIASGCQVQQEAVQLHFCLTERRIAFFHPGHAPPKL